MMLSATLSVLISVLPFGAVPEPSGSVPLPRLERESSLSQSFVVAGEGALVVGNESGELEVWIWPFKVAERIKPWIRLQGEEPIPLDAHRVAFAQRPESATALYRLPSGAEVAMHVFVPRERRAASLMFEAPGLGQHAVIELHLSPSLRMVWPASSDGISPYMQVLGEEAVVIHNAVASGPTVFAAVTGTHPLRERVLPEGGTSIAEPMPPGETVVVGFGLDEEQWGRAADQARELVRHHDFEVRRAGEWYRQALDGTRVRTGDSALDQAFIWSQLSLMRAQMRSTGNVRVLAAGFGPSAGGNAPGPAWTSLPDLRHIARLALPLGMGDQLTSVLDELTRRDLRPADGGRLIPSLLSLSDQALRETSYRYEPDDAPAHLLLTLTEFTRWTGDAGLLRKHTPLLSDSLTGWTPDGLDSATSLQRAALWWEASVAAEAALTAAGGTAPGLEALRGARSDLEQRLSDAWNSEIGWFLDAGDLAPLSPEGIRFLASDPDRTPPFARFLEQQGLVAPWGVRTLAPRASGYSPYRSSSGAVDPLVTAEAAIAVRYADSDLAWRLLSANAGLMTELAPGCVPRAVRSDELAAVDHPYHTAGACMVGAGVLEAVLGVDPDGTHGRLAVAPLHVATGTGIEIDGLRVGRGQVDLRLDEAGNLHSTYRGPGELEVAYRSGGSERVGTLRESEPLSLRP